MDLTITLAERQNLATLYQAGQTLWRVPIPHFSPWDCNWPYGPPDGAVGPNQPAPRTDHAPALCATWIDHQLPESSAGRSAGCRRARRINCIT